MLRDLLGKIKKTVLLVTHDLDEALYLASRIVLMAGGKVIADLPAEEFLASEHPEVQAYVRAFHRGEQSVTG
jgi:osmoprotectant transport system ATP-binding protein